VCNDGWETWKASSYRVGLHVASAPPDPNTLPFDAAGYPTRLSLPADVPPGSEASIDLDLPAPGATGKWYVQADVVEEGVTWFETQGDIPMLLTVEVVDQMPEGGAAGAGQGGSGQAGGSSGGSSSADASIGSDGSTAGGGAGAGGSKPVFASGEDDGCGCAQPGRRGAGAGWLLAIAAMEWMRRRGALGVLLRRR